MNFNLRGRIVPTHPYQLDKTLTVEGAGAEAKTTGERINAVQKTAEDHIGNKINPHNVTKEQLGLGSVDNTPDNEKPVSVFQAEAIADAKLAGTVAQEAAENAQTTANNAQTAADNAQTAADNAQSTANNAQTAAENALKESKEYTDGKHLPLTATITAADWTEELPYQFTLNAEGIVKDDLPHVTPVYSDILETALEQKESWSMVNRAKANDGSITFYCFEDKPTVDIPIQIEVNR